MPYGSLLRKVRQTSVCRRRSNAPADSDKLKFVGHQEPKPQRFSTQSVENPVENRPIPSATFCDSRTFSALHTFCSNLLNAVKSNYLFNCRQSPSIPWGFLMCFQSSLGI